jgi:hypothetical protein
MEDEDEPIGLDFRNFYYLWRCVLAVKQYGKTAYGSVNEVEFTAMFETNAFFSRVIQYMKGSFLMTGDY